MSPAIFYSVLLVFWTSVHCCPTNIHGFKSNTSFHIIQEKVIASGHQVTLNEQICMLPNFCFNREYTALIKNETLSQLEKTSKECDLQFPITVTKMTIEKTKLNISLNPIFINMSSPVILRERLKAMHLIADLDEMVLAGVWRVNHACWMKNNRSLKECGMKLFLNSKLMNQTIDILKVESWILEPVEAFRGIMRSFHIYFSPHFFLKGVQTLLDQCCYRNIHLEGTKYANVTITNQTELETLFVKHTSNFNLRVDLESMPQLVSLSLPETTMAHLPADLKYLHNLEILDVAYNNLTSLQSHFLTSTKLKVLNVSDNNLKTLPFTINNILNLVVLKASRNQITANNLSEISQLEKLEILDLSHNAIENIPKELSGMKNLKVLDLNYNHDLSAFNFFEDSKELFVSLEVLKLSNTGYVVTNGNDILERVNSFKYLDLSGNDRFTWADRPFEFLIGKDNLTYLNFSGVNMNRTGCLGSSLPNDYGRLEPLLKLRTLDLSHCNLQSLKVSTFLNFPALEYLDLSSNKLKLISSNLITALSKLKVLSLSHNLFSSIHLQLPPNTRLKKLELSYNQILSPDGILDSGLVTSLDLSHNNITRWTNISTFSRVQKLDLSYNNIEFFTQDMRRSLQVLESVNLDVNSINCQECSTIKLQNWLNENSSNNILKFTCAWPLDKKGIDVIMVHVDRRTCFTKDDKHVPIIIAATVLGTTFIILTFFLYKYRLQIHYMLHAYGMKRRYQKKQDFIQKEYDAFICYSGLDSTWVSNELSPNLEKEPENYKFCIHERDFPVGAFIMHNIHTAIKSSRHTIVVLSNKFLSSSWCRWELELTNYTMVHEDRDLIIIIELEHLNKERIPSFLRFLMNTRTYLEWPRKNTDQASKDWAFSRLRAALGKSIFQQKNEAASRA